ncbi:MAG: hypothetical protein UR26_C0002G0022 [candidate division TM6 bacterium GW2011_GWF2_32_72]|nr:MAG: hypothetical protein UR26_C0002G0022 [candidate division TM6 bacterium GW2011_GWF2_32_72]
MENNGLYDIYDISYKPFWHTFWFKFFLILFLILSIFIVTYLIWKKFFKKIVLVSPLEKAQQRLNILEASFNKGDLSSRMFFFQLLFIIRNVLENHCSLNVGGRTDTELMTYLNDLKFDADIINYLGQIIQGSVLIRFANKQSAQEESEKALILTKNILSKLESLSQKQYVK